MTAMQYAELQVTTNYSFLRSGSHPGELVFQAANLGYYAIGVADRNTLAGVVRAYSAVREYYEETAIPEESWIKLLVGARLETIDGYSLLAYPMNIEGYKRLSLLLSKGNEHAAKGECKLTFELLAEYADHILAFVLRRGTSKILSSMRSCAGSPASIVAAAISPPPCCSVATMRRAWPTSTISRRR